MPQRRSLKLLTLRCREATEIASRTADGPVPRLDRLALRLHTAACRSCRRFRCQLAALRTRIAELEAGIASGVIADQDGLSDEARGRLEQLVAERATDRGA